MMAKAIAQWGKVDILVNCAGIVRGRSDDRERIPFWEISDYDWHLGINTNLTGAFYSSRAVMKHMVERQQGNIINIASTMAFRALSENGTYCVAKAGIIMLTKVLAVELAEYNIRANAIAPGLTKTKFSEKVWRNARLLSETEKLIPLKRIADPDDMIGAAVFLASDASSYMTGQTICIDGGESAVENFPEISQE